MHGRRTTCPGQDCCANLRSVVGPSEAVGIEFWTKGGGTGGIAIREPFSFAPPPLLLDILFYIQVYASHEHSKST